MVCVALQLVGLILGTISWFGMIATCASAEWRRNRSGNAILDMSVRYEGLWHQCRQYMNGESKCKPYDKLFVGVPAVLQVCRALMIASLVLGLFANIITILGMRCTSVGNRNPQAKARAAIVGGILFLVSAILCGVAVSYYAHIKVVQEYYNPVLDNLPVHAQFEYGNGLLLGWASLVGGTIGGVMICFTTISIHVKQAKISRSKNKNQRHMQRVHGQRHQHIPLSHHQRHATSAMQSSHLKDNSLLTKQRVAQHNATLHARNGHGHSHHVHAHVNHRGHEAKARLTDPSKSAGGGPQWTADVDHHLEGSSRHHRHYDTAPDSKSQAELLKTSSRDCHRDSREKNDIREDAVLEHARKRPANEYV